MYYECLCDCLFSIQLKFNYQFFLCSILENRQVVVSDIFRLYQNETNMKRKWFEYPFLSTQIMRQFGRTLTVCLCSLLWLLLFFLQRLYFLYLFHMVSMLSLSAGSNAMCGKQNKKLNECPLWLYFNTITFIYFFFFSFRRFVGYFCSVYFIMIIRWIARTLTTFEQTNKKLRVYKFHFDKYLRINIHTQRTHARMREKGKHTCTSIKKKDKLKSYRKWRKKNTNQIKSSKSRPTWRNIKNGYSMHVLNTFWMHRNSNIDK